MMKYILVTAIAFFCLAFVVAAADITLSDSEPTYNLSCPDYDYDLECPKPKCPEPNVKNVQNVDIPYNNIQAPHVQVDYRLSGDEFTIENIDQLGETIGASMQPTMFSGNVILLRDYEGQDLKEGMIVEYDTGKDRGVHRIKGDYQGTSDRVLVTGDSSQGSNYIKISSVERIAVGVIFK